MNELALLENKRIENMIYEIRGKQVMLDSDLAELYQCANGTKTINQAIRRHKDRFPNDFYFQLTEEEAKLKKLPYVFTEQGVAAMHATVIRTQIASEISVQIMRAFVTMRKYISTNLLEQKYINNQVMKNTEDIRILKEAFSQFDEKRKINEIFFEGKIYDVYSKILSIFKAVMTSLVIIDGYADNTVLDMFSKISVSVTLIIKESLN